MSEKPEEKNNIFDDIGKSILIVIVLVLIVISGNVIYHEIMNVTSEEQVSDSVSIASSSALVNPNFDGSFYCYQNDCMLTTATGWEPKWIEGVNKDSTCSWPCIRPEYQPETRIVRSGTSQHYHVTDSRMRAGICQKVDVNQWDWVKFSVWAYVVSEPDGFHTVQACVLPWGQYTDDITDLSVTCGIESVGDRGPIYRKWTEVSVTAQARSNAVWVCLLSQVEYSERNQTVLVDDASFVNYGPTLPGQAQPTATPRPTYTVYPTNTPQPTYTPLPTHTPAPACTPGPISDKLYCFDLLDENTGDLYRRCRYGNDVWVLDEEGAPVCPK